MADQVPELPIVLGRAGSARRARSSPTARAATSSAAPATEDTMRANLEAFGRWRIVPRMLRDVAERDLAREVLGTPMPAPRAARADRRAVDPPPRRRAGRPRAPRPRTGVPMIAQHGGVAHAGGRSPRRAATAPRWYQLYWPRGDELARELRPARRGGRLQRDRRHARHGAAGLAPARPRRRLPAVPQGRSASPTTSPTRSSASTLEKPPEEDPQAAVGQFVGVVHATRR